MSTTCWFYVSRSLIAPASVEAEIERIVDISRPRNAGLQVSGALAFARDMFTQYLEGPAEAIEQLRGSIEHDPRHADVVTIRTGPADSRHFALWSLAYTGPASYMARAIEKTLLASLHDPRRDVDALLELLTQMAAKG